MHGKRKLSCAPIPMATSSGEGSSPRSFNRDLQPSTSGLPDAGAPRTVPMAKKSLLDTSLCGASQTARQQLQSGAKYRTR